MPERRSPEPVGPRSTSRASARLRAATRPRRLRWAGRRLVRWLGVALLVVVPCAAWGASTATAQGSLGPHTARYDVTLDSEVTVDLGPLGTLVIDSPVPVVGVRVVVQEIPREVTAVEASATLESLATDLEDYIQFFNAPQESVRAAAQDLVTDAIRRTAVAVVVVSGVLLLLRAALGARRRAELRDDFRPHHVAAASALSALLLVGGLVTASTPLAADTSRERTASSVFDGTPLAGARITGRLAGVIDTYGGYAVDAYRENEVFYADATAAVRQAWTDRAERDEQLAEALAAGRPPVPSGAQDEEEEENAGPEPVVMLLVSDLHCNVGMAGPMRAVAELAGATVVLNAGDTTVNGSVVEAYCVTAFVDAVPDGAQMIAVMGNHDGPDTAAQARDAGVTLLEGEVIEVEGIRILGDADPRATRIGVGTTLTGVTTLDDVSEHLADVACEHPNDVDLLLIHDPAVGERTLKASCVPSQISGHRHRREGPLWMSPGTLYVSSSTAGATLNQPTIGPLSHQAEMTVLRLDPVSGRVLDYRVVRVMPDGTASVGAAVRWPQAPPQPQPISGYY